MNRAHGPFRRLPDFADDGQVQVAQRLRNVPWRVSSSVCPLPVEPLSTSENGITKSWDGHTNIEQNHRGFALETDQPIGALLTDLKRSGLLDEVLVIWGGEFGRLPLMQRTQGGAQTGRDHNPHAFTYWFAGAGVKGGHHHGETDELGHRAVVDRVSVNDLHATILHLLGMDHERLTYRYNGRDFRLTDVAGRVVRGILA